MNACIYSPRRHGYVLNAAGFSVDDRWSKEILFAGLKSVHNFRGQVIDLQVPWPIPISHFMSILWLWFVIKYCQCFNTSHNLIFNIIPSYIVSFKVLRLPFVAFLPPCPPVNIYQALRTGPGTWKVQLCIIIIN